MTVTQRRARNDAQSDERPVTEPGIKYTCDFCHVDITHTVRIKCAMKECEEVDLCPSCFCEGKEGLRHKAWHDYKVVEQHSQPIFSPDWGADEELLLVSGLISNGLGNWLEVAQHVGTRTKEECEKHYLEVYLGPMDKNFNVDPDEFQARKKARIEEMRKPHALPPPNAAPLVSAPTNHEVAGFMPGRLEFEHEVDNEAEMAVKDMEFGLVFKYGGDAQPEAKITRPPEEEEEEDGDAEAKEEEGEEVKVKPEPEGDGTEDQPVAGPSSSPVKDVKGKGKAKGPPLPDIEDEDELEVKLAMLDIYFSKLDKRMDAKEILFDRALTEHKKIQAAERKRPKEERELIQRYKVFAKFQTAQDFEVLIEGLIYEQNLRKRITELQEYRRMGITTNAEAEAYDNAKAARAGYRPLVQRDRPEVTVSGARINAGQHRFLHGGMGTPPPGGDPKSREPTPRVIPTSVGRKPPTPLNLANAASLDLLSHDEQLLCSSLRVLPKPYLAIKELYVRENARRSGCLKRRDARRMLKIDVNKSGKIFDFLVDQGILVLKYDIHAGPRQHQLNGIDEQSFSLGKDGVFEGININGVGLGPLMVDEIRLNGS
uniref:Transcriptional adapter 2 n=1 Tax=Kwoniella bestiolae CBS 10118 TaxID=1296100 RepID=A0A1B9GDX2_9TREE|nr:transcriptional adapter 2-alpha [Kwoniella bestiolae CBS 10118]OCF29207.1 transcriptional adapter 2-alpha [Kwoniella bestiolae CBS 10118]